MSNTPKEPHEMSEEEIQAWLTECRRERKFARKSDETRFKAICYRFKQLGADERLGDKDFTNDDVDFLISMLFEARAKITSLQNDLDPDGFNQRAMQIIREAAKHLENKESCQA